MGDHLDTGTLLAREAGEGAGPRRSVLFLVHRAADGWLALDLEGEELARFSCCERGVLRCLSGGASHSNRVFSLYALDLDPESCGGLRVPTRGDAQFGFGGDLGEVLRQSCRRRSLRLLLFRGATALPWRSRAIPARTFSARATPELVFETPPGALWEVVRRIACERGGPASPLPTNRSDNGSCRVAAPGSARGRTG
jgi:hypothetical protein